MTWWKTRAAAPQGGDAIRTLALDLDGTLLTSAKRVSADALATLRALRGRGLQIVAVTGKAPRLSAGCLAPLDLPMVCLDGAVHLVAGAERWVPATTIGAPLAAEVLAAAAAAPCYLLADGVTLVRGAVPERQFVDWSDQVARLESPQQLRRVTHVIFPHRDRAALTRLAKRVAALPARLGGDQLSLYLTEEPFYDYYCLFVRNTGCTKLRGMRSLAQRLGVTLDRIMFIGDWMNDIPLLRAVGYPVAMRHAPPAVSSCARAMTLFGNDEDGVSRFLRAYFAVVPAPGLAALGG